MTALRRLAEEWDFAIALDLIGPVDPRWEAEAPVSRLGSRLTLIRLVAQAAIGSAFGRHRPGARALAAAVGGGPATNVVIVPRGAILQSARTPALMRGRALTGAR